MQNNMPDPNSEFTIYPGEPEQPKGSSIKDLIGEQLLQTPRHLARTGARAVETLINTPENIAKLGMGAMNLGVKGSNLLRRGIGLPEEEEFKYPEALEDLGGKVTGLAEKFLPEGTLKAKNETEAKVDEVVSDLISLMTPIPGLGKGAKIVRALGMSGAGNAVKWLAESTGSSKDEQEVVKMATMLAVGMMGPGKLNATKAGIYKARDTAIEKGLEHGISPYVENKLTPLFERYSKQLSESGEPGAKSHKFIEQRLEGIEHNIKLPAEEAGAKVAKSVKVKEQPFQAPSTHVIKPKVAPKPITLEVAGNPYAEPTPIKVAPSEAVTEGKKNIIYENGKMKVVPYNEPVPEIPVKAETTTPAEVSAVEQPAKKVPVSGRVAKMEVKHAKEMQKQALNAHKEQAKALKEQASKQTKAEAALKKEATAKNKADVEVEKLKTKAAEKAAQEAKEDVKRIHKQMADLEKQVQREAAEEAKAQVKAKPKYKKELHIEDLIKLKSNLNEIRNEGIPANAKTFFNREYATIKKMIDEYGKRNPTFKVAHEIAEDVHGGLTNASKVNAFMQKHITATRLGLGTIALLIGHGVGWHHPVTWGALGVAGGARYGLQSIEALMRSPNMRKYYGNVVKAAVKKDVPVMLKQANNLDKVMKAEEKKNAPKSEGEFIVYS